MFQDLVRLLLVVVFIIIVQQGSARDAKQKHGGESNSTKTTNIPKNRTTDDNNKFNKNAKILSKRLAKLRKNRGISLAALAGLDRTALGLNPLTVPYGTRLASLGYQQAPTLQQLPQYRGLVPATGGLIQNTAALRLPYGLQLARLIPALNLYRNRLQLPGNGVGMATDVHVYKGPNRLKYDSIPLKPAVEQQALMSNGLALPALLQLNSAGDQGLGEIPDESEADLDELGGVCLTNPCHNGGSCVNVGETFECICRKGFTGKKCKERNPCLPNPCHNDGQCTVSGSSFDCSCTIGWKGERCEEPNKCHPNPCMNGGSCTELQFDYECTCPHGFHGKSCEDKRTSCSQNPCLNDGHCIETSSGSYECVCKPGFSGMTCAVTQNKCLQNPCENGGTCIDSMGGAGYECRCPVGYKGINCEERSPCQPDTCENGGTCFETQSGFKCLCREGYSGKSCSARHSCQPNVCKNGAKCIEHDNGFKCICPSGYKGSYCDELDHCRPNPCQHGGDCVETENGFKCHCQAQYQGLHCEDLNMCIPNPCKNGGQCLGYEGGHKCICLPGYKGENCEEKNPCEPNPCHNGGGCLQQGDHYKCTCRRGYTGEQCKMVDSCLSNPCQHGGTCKAEEGGFVCTCPASFRGTFCNEREPCHPNPCHNGGKCLSTSDGFVCRCATGYRGETCTEEDECQPNPCLNGGRCMAHYFGGGFDCECPLGYRGTTCMEKDPCRPNPCGHGGFCTEIGGGFACNCTLGFKGSTCQEIDQCRPNPCQHGGYCREVVGGTGFACQCITGYKGSRCEEKDRCHPNPCLHDGMCMEINDELGFLCNCTTGYRGTHCQDVDPCRPNPCLNSGACLHTDDGFVCNCSRGFKGQHCQERDLCKPNPCQFGNKCHQTGVDSYQCVKNLCNPSPCLHDGRCIEINEEDYMCACKPGYTGKNCNEFVSQVNADGRHNVPVFHSTALPNNLKAASPTHAVTGLALQSNNKPTASVCSPNPCQNGGSCSINGHSFDCSCTKGFKGKHCEINNPCIPNPCNNGGTCLLGEEGNYVCRCPTAFAGASCEEATKVQRVRPKPHMDYCTPNPCKNRGVCVVEEGKGYSCACEPGFTGFHCQVDHCSPNPCRNHGLCLRDKASRYKCNCQNGFLGRNCEVNSCVPNPCKNNGLCVTVRGRGYQCKCREGFNGPHCENNPCYPNPCNNGGSCLVFYTVYLCKCPRAYRGTRCNVLIPEQALAPAPHPVSSANFITEVSPVRKTTEHLKANACTSNPCLNSAVCLETIDDSFECFCRGDFSGPRCEDVGAYKYSSAPKFFPGKGEECQHCDRNAHCVGGHCICKHGFVGDGLDCWVETQRDKDWTCLANPCKNGGTCKTGISKCVCRLGYVGDYCESHCPPSVHLSFDKFTQGALLDDSGSENSGVLANGAQIVPHGGKCGNAANLLGGDVLLDGAHFNKIPREGITISTWVKLDTNKGIQSIFDTVGSHSKHKDGQYHFEIENGKVRWFHRNENHDTIFTLLTRPVVREGIWTQITATYNAAKQRARVFVNGDMREEVKGQGLLSLDWGGKAGIGRHKHQFGNRLLRGMIDEFYIFPCELPRLEILVLMRHCRVYFTHNPKKVTEGPSTTRGSAAIMTPPINGQRNNGPIPLHEMHPAAPQRIASLAPSYQRKPAPTDYVASNLQQILASLTAEVPHRSGINPSALYGPPQGYSAPPSQNKPQMPGRTTTFTNVRPLSGPSQQVPQIWSANMWGNHPPGLVAPFATQPSIRHNTPGSMQQVNINRQPNVAPPLLPQTVNRHDQTQVRMQPLNAYYPPGTLASTSAQALAQHNNQAVMQKVNVNRPSAVVPQMNTVGGQRAPLKQTFAGQFQSFNALKNPNGPQNQGTKIFQPKVSLGRINSAEQFHTPIIWHTPLANTRKGQPVRLQRPYFPASSATQAGQRILGPIKQMNFFQGAPVRNRTAGNTQNPYVLPFQQLSLSQKPFLQKPRIEVMQPPPTQSNKNPQSGGPKAQVPIYLPKQQKQQSLADKMAMLEEPNHAPYSHVPASSPWQKQMPSTQLATLTQKQTPPSRLYYATSYPKPPYSLNVQHGLLTTSARMQSPSKGLLAPATQKIPQRIPQRQISPFSPHFISGQNSWPWGAWRNQASPIAQASSRSSTFSRFQANGNTLPNYHPSAGLVTHLPASPYTASPQVLLYYYYYPKTINKPLTKMASPRGEKLDGSSLQKLTLQINSAAFNNKAMTKSKPTVTGQTAGKATVPKSNKVPYGNSKQHSQIPYVAYYNPVTGSASTPLVRGMFAGPLAKQFHSKKPVQVPLLLHQLRKGSGQLTSPPLVTYRTALTPPNVAYPNAKVITQPRQRTVYQQLPALADRKSQLTNGLLNRPIYIETVPYQLYYQLQKLPSFNTQSGTQRYLSRVLNDILRLRYGKRKKKKKKRGVKEKSVLHKKQG
ncbi:uncharacterized protein LOC144666194 isoform X4 [Oculina patagonica]